MKLRAGYIYDLTPVPDASFDPQVPDANRHIFTVGQDLKIWRFTLGIAYNYILSESPHQKQHHCDQRGCGPLTSQRALQQ